MIAMTLALEPISPPLTVLPDGTVRVGHTRVNLESVVTLFQNGLSAESIAEAFPTLYLNDVYAVITYYLNHREEVEAYLHEYSTEADQLQQDLQKRFTPGLRERLLARKRTDAK